MLLLRFVNSRVLQAPPMSKRRQMAPGGFQRAAMAEARGRSYERQHLLGSCPCVHPSVRGSRQDIYDWPTHCRCELSERSPQITPRKPAFLCSGKRLAFFSAGDNFDLLVTTARRERDGMRKLGREREVKGRQAEVYCRGPTKKKDACESEKRDERKTDS